MALDCSQDRGSRRRSGAIPIVLGGDHTITWPDATGVARAHGWGRIGVIHFDAHADTGDITFGSLIGHANSRAIGAVWKRLVGREYPAMTLVGVTRLWDDDALVEIEGIAILP